MSSDDFYMTVWAIGWIIVAMAGVIVVIIKG